MWTFEDASRIGASDMDSRRACPSYEAGFDVCDPLGSVLEWSGSGRAPARVLRRRCRSEGVDRSPYEDVSREAHRSADGYPRYRALPNKSHFTLNSAETPYERFQHECSLPAAVNGDYIMAHEPHRHHGYQPGRSKFHRTSPTRPLLVTTLSNTKVDDRLPKVEELLEKVDQEMMEVQVAKQPLKSILNNPLPKSPPQSILKKPKNRSYQECKLNEGRRRQRAASESDNLYCNFHIGSPIPGYDNRLSYLSSSMKRAKDNSGTGYSYGTAIASLSNTPTKSSSNYSKSQRCTCKDQVIVTNKDEVHNIHILRTTAINNDTVGDSPVVEMPRQDTPTPTCPAVSPALPVSSVTAIVGKKGKSVKKKAKSKIKVAKMKSSSKTECSAVDGEADDAHSRSPSPDTTDSAWQMDTDTVPADIIDRVERTFKREDHPDPNSINKLSTKLNGTVVSPKKVPSKESPLSLPDAISSCLRPSLFPRVPPYLKFVGHEDTVPLKIPVPIQKHLKWKLTTITPIVVKKTLTNSGFRLVKSECDTAECPQEETVEWIGIWGKHMKSLMFRAIKDGQKMNHFPGTFQIGRKDRLWRNLQKLAIKFGVNEFGIMPKTYVLPHDLRLLKHDWEKYAANNEKWIIKPPASARGTGIKVVSRWTQIPKKRPVVVQRYVAKPYLINGNKFDMRLYVLVTSVHPLRVYLYKDGLARFASVKYNDELTSLNDRYMHLTNYSINRLSKNYTPNEDFAACEGHKWTLQTLFHYLKTEKNVDTDALWDSMKDLVIKTIISGEASISSLTKANVTSRYNCYELFGIDVLLDEDLKPWLLEVNISPSLHSASPLDIHVKGPLVSTVLNIAQFQVPIKTNLEMLSKEKPHKLAGLPYDSRLYTVYLSKEERDKHIIYTNMEERDMYLRDILSTLTPDDVRHLIQAEDELTQAGDMERVFPTHDTHKYLLFLAGPRYYNRLFDAWEARYAANRTPGLELLRNLCEIGYHLEVPPVPLKNDVDAPSPAASERASVPSVPSAGSLERECAAPAPAPAPATAPAPAPRLCGDALPRPPPPPAIEPRA
ncbi:tubulin polyglutamylase TTLL4-like isoform X2 [Ostrinia furnacalis]|uniref:tubulin polyglutamylase TTLL4-like isoform X2 n=1 Tax=Ostrinia furnacalis TaxID=93504 RepID=UPI001038E952|nr:tubulin polyglutamylase TTLL4-like isoform X2 [Ostrinia furnacalis]